MICESHQDLVNIWACLKMGDVYRQAWAISEAVLAKSMDLQGKPILKQTMNHV